MAKKRKFCLVTGSRSEYGILFWLLKEINQDDDLILQLIVTGMHLSKEYGLTYKQIEMDGFKINEKIALLNFPNFDTELGISKSIAKGVIGFTKAYMKLKPDIVVLLGDRYEIFAAAVAAYVSGIPVAHIHGGETTTGALDEGFRHAITKMAYIHFPSIPMYAKRIIKMGEFPNRVFVFGSPALDYIKRTEFLTKAQLEKELNFELKKPIAVVTYHPETLGSNRQNWQIKNLFKALDFLKFRIIFTFPGADIGSNFISKKIEIYASKKKSTVRIFRSLGQKKYLTLLKYADIMIGNSSSGIHEAVSFKLPVVNIGNRQANRFKPLNVIDCGYNAKDIIKAAKKAFSEKFRQKIKRIKNPFGDGNASSRIKEKLKEIKIIKQALAKKFYDK